MRTGTANIDALVVVVATGCGFCRACLAAVFFAAFLFLGGPAPVQAQDATPEKSRLAKVNETLFSYLFFDVAGGAITIHEVDKDNQPVLDENGNPKEKVVGVPFLIVGNHDQPDQVSGYMI